MSDTTYKLWCLVEGDKTPFSIIASTTTFIGELQKMIKKEKSDALQSFDASSLILWKVRFSSDNFDITGGHSYH
jgi:Crinkler effector protein N-terminal domain